MIRRTFNILRGRSQSGSSGGIADMFSAEVHNMLSNKESSSSEQHQQIVYSDVVRPFMEKRLGRGREKAISNDMMSLSGISHEMRRIDKQLDRDEDEENKNDIESAAAASFHQEAEEEEAAGKVPQVRRRNDNKFIIERGLKSLREEAEEEGPKRPSPPPLQPNAPKPPPPPRIAPTTAGASTQTATAVPPKTSSSAAAAAAVSAASAAADAETKSSPMPPPEKRSHLHQPHHQQQHQKQEDHRYIVNTTRRIAKLSPELVPELFFSQHHGQFTHLSNVLDTPIRRRVRNSIRSTLLGVTKAAAAGRSETACSPQKQKLNQQQQQQQQHRVRLLVTGPRGIGKSANISLLVNDLRKEGHLVVYLRARALSYHGLSQEDFVSNPTDTIFALLRHEIRRVQKHFFPQHMAAEWLLAAEVERVFQKMKSAEAKVTSSSAGWSTLLQQNQQQHVDPRAAAAAGAGTGAFVGRAALVALFRTISRDLVLMCDRVRKERGSPSLKEEGEMIKKLKQQQREERKQHQQSPPTKQHNQQQQQQQQVIPGVVLVVDDIEALESLALLHGGADGVQSLCRLLLVELQPSISVFARNRPVGDSPSGFQSVFRKFHMPGQHLFPAGVAASKVELLTMPPEQMTADEAAAIFCPPCSDQQQQQHQVPDRQTTWSLTRRYPPKFLFEWVARRCGGYSDAFGLLCAAYSSSSSRFAVSWAPPPPSRGATAAEQQQQEQFQPPTQIERKKIQLLQSLVMAKLRYRITADLMDFYASLSEPHRRAFERNVVELLDQQQKREELHLQQEEMTKLSAGAKIIDERWMMLHYGQLRSTVPGLVRDAALDVVRSFGLPEQKKEDAAAVASSSKNDENHNNEDEADDSPSSTLSEKERRRRRLNSLSTVQKQALLRRLAELKRIQRESAAAAAAAAAGTTKEPPRGDAPSYETLAREYERHFLDYSLFNNELLLGRMRSRNKKRQMRARTAVIRENISKLDAMERRQKQQQQQPCTEVLEQRQREMMEAKLAKILLTQQKKINEARSADVAAFFEKTKKTWEGERVDLRNGTLTYQNFLRRIEHTWCEKQLLRYKTKLRREWTDEGAVLLQNIINNLTQRLRWIENNTPPLAPENESKGKQQQQQKSSLSPSSRKRNSNHSGNEPSAEEKRKKQLERKLQNLEWEKEEVQEEGARRQVMAELHSQKDMHQQQQRSGNSIINSSSGSVNIRVRRRSGRIVTVDSDELVNNTGLRTALKTLEERELRPGGGGGRARSQQVWTECRSHPAHITDATCLFMHFAPLEDLKKKKKLSAAATNEDDDAATADPEQQQVLDLAESLRQAQGGGSAVDVKSRKFNQTYSSSPVILFESPKAAKRFYKRAHAASDQLFSTGMTSFPRLVDVPQNIRAQLNQLSQHFAEFLRFEFCPARDAAAVLRAMPVPLKVVALRNVGDAKNLRHLVREKPTHLEKVLREVAMATHQKRDSAGSTAAAIGESAEILAVTQFYSDALAPLIVELAQECGFAGGGSARTAASREEEEKEQRQKEESSDSFCSVQHFGIITLEHACEIVSCISDTFNSSSSAAKAVADDVAVLEICRRVTEAAAERYRTSDDATSNAQESSLSCSSHPGDAATARAAAATTATAATAAPPQSLEELVKLLEVDDEAASAVEQQQQQGDSHEEEEGEEEGEDSLSRRDAAAAGADGDSANGDAWE